MRGLRFLSLVFLAAGLPVQADEHSKHLDRIGEALVRSYPGIVVKHSGNSITFADGTTMQIDDGRKKSYYEKLEDADIEDMFSIPYRTGLRDFKAPAENDDPGRIRCEAFFDKVYGPILRDGEWQASPELRDNLTEMSVTLNGKPARLTFSKANGASAALAKALEEIAALPPEKRAFASASEGTFVIRAISANDFKGIASKRMVSSHAWGIGLDLRPAKSSPAHKQVFRYWKWETEAPEKKEDREYLQVYPPEIVEILEKNGFIWGGKWYHYDPIHFEFRPELLPYEKQKGSGRGGFG